jgi:hypothetical protein
MQAVKVKTKLNHKPKLQRVAVMTQIALALGLLPTSWLKQA